ncbi:kek1 (predicted) [Pycnogonum litorale]
MLIKYILLVIMNLLCNHRCLSQSVCYPKCVCMWKNGKQTVECVEIGLNKIPTTLSSDTQVLDMTGNFIKTLSDNQFINANLLNIQRLFLRKCQLHRIESEAFKKLQNLVELDLSVNMLPAIPSPSFRHCVSIRRLVLNNNPISRIEASAFAHLTSMVALEVRQCQLEAISNRAFVALDKVEFLKLDGNRLQTLHGKAMLPMKSIRGLDLHDNPWNCDCQLQTLLKLIRKGKIPINVPTVCMGPPRLYKKRWSSVDINDFACEPKVIDSSSTYQEGILEGSNITLLCEVKGDPAPKIYWSHKGHKVKNQTEVDGMYDSYVVYETGTLNKRSTLFIPYLRLEDSSRYACVAENIAGKVSRNFTLIVLANTVEVETIRNKDDSDVHIPPDKGSFFPPKELIIGISVGIGILLILVCFLLVRCSNRQLRFRNRSKNNTSDSAMCKHSNSTNHVASVTTEGSIVCEDQDITLLDVIKTKPLPRLGPYECIPTADLDNFDIIRNQNQMSPNLPAYVVQPGAQTAVHSGLDIWREYPNQSRTSPLGLGVSCHRTDIPAIATRSQEAATDRRRFTNLQIELQNEMTDTLRRKGLSDRSKIIPISGVTVSTSLDQRERGDGSSEQSNTTSEFTEPSSRHPNNDKRHHRQSWECMVNNDSINENDVYKSYGSPDTRQEKDQIHLRNYQRTELSPTARQSRDISPTIVNPPDCVKPFLEKRDTEV